MTAFDLEVMISERGREVMLELLQGHMDLRSIHEPQLTEVVDADGIRLCGSRGTMSGS